MNFKVGENSYDGTWEGVLCGVEFDESERQKMKVGSKIAFEEDAEPAENEDSDSRDGHEYEKRRVKSAVRSIVGSVKIEESEPKTLDVNLDNAYRGRHLVCEIRIIFCITASTNGTGMKKKPIWEKN